MIPLEPNLVRTLEGFLEKLEDYVRDHLGPQFAAARMQSDDGAVVVRGWNGEPGTASYQAAVARAGAAFEQRGLIAEDSRRIASRAIDFIVRNLWDEDYGGWVDRPSEMEAGKLLVTQARVLAALADFLTVSGDFEVADRLVESFKVIQVFAADNASGGYGARFDRDWTVIDPASGVQELTALAESFALAHQALGTEIYKRRALETLVRAVSLGGSRQPAVWLGTLELIGGNEDVSASILESSESYLAADAELSDFQAFELAAMSLEAWRRSGEALWLERFAGAVKGREPAALCEGFIMSGAVTFTGAIPGVLRIEMLLLKALYASG